MEKMKKRYLVTMFAFCCMLFSGLAALAASAETVYTKISYPEKNVTASSFLGDSGVWELSKLANAGRGDWTAQWGWTDNPSADEWIEIDLGAEKNVGKVVLHNESGKSMPRQLRLWSGKDRQSWTSLGSYALKDSDWSAGAYPLTFAPVATRYLRISLLEKGVNGTNRLISLSNIEVYGSDQTPATPDYLTQEEITVEVSGSLTPDYGADKLIDGKSADQTSSATYWSGELKNNLATDGDEIVMDAGSVKTIGEVGLFPRMVPIASGTPAAMYGFPKSFRFEYSEDKEIWKPVRGASYQDYEANVSWNDFAFRTPMRARYIRLVVTERGKAGADYLTQFSEVRMFSSSYVRTAVAYEELTVSSATSSGNYTADEGADKAIDGNLKTRWTAPWGYAEHKYSDESLTLDLGDSQLVGKISLYVGSTRQPKALRILGSADAKSWGFLYENANCAYTGGALEAVFDSCQIRYLRVEIFEKGMDKTNYLSALNEVKVYTTDEAEPAAELVTYTDITPTTADSVKVISGGTSAGKLIDGVTANKTASSNHWNSDPSAEPSVDGSNSALGFDGFYYQLGESAVSVDRLSVFPRFDAVPGSVFGFPVDFKLIYSVNGQIWYQVPGQSYTDYVVKSGWNEFLFSSRISAKYLGICVEERGKNGELYTVEFSEARAFASDEDREPVRPSQEFLDLSKVTVEAFEPAASYYTYEEFSLRLSDYFSYSLDLPLLFETNVGKTETRDGEPCFVFTPDTAGEQEIVVKGYPEGKQAKAEELKFRMTVTSKADPDVIVFPYTTDMEYAVGVAFRLDLSEVFLYEGSAKLQFTTTQGKIETADGKNWLVFAGTQAGDVVILVTAAPEGKPDKAETAEIAVKVVDAPEVKPQPPVYKNEENTGCGCGTSDVSDLSGIALLILGAGFVFVAVRHGKMF